MRLRQILITTAAVLALTPVGVAAANDRHGWYIGLEAGWAFVDDTGLPGVPGFQSIEYDSGPAGFLTVGHAFNNRWRLEIEGGYRSNDADTNNGVPATDGELTEYTGMINVLYDWRVGGDLAINLGAGAGVDMVHFDDHLGRRDSDAKPALQGIVGLTQHIGQHWDLMVTYRYLWVNEPEFVIGGVQTDMDISKHTLSVGLRYGYDEPPAPPAPPPPPPAPPPPMVKQFVIFFGFAKCNITAEADAVLSEAAAAAKASGSASVRIVGHTDSVGSDAHNQKLSECRANAAAENLAGKGVPAGAISTSGKGESELMVQTGDGVKEPQNRRATVDLN